MKICSNCSSSNLDTSRFCSACGEKLEPIGTLKGKSSISTVSSSIPSSPGSSPGPSAAPTMLPTAASTTPSMASPTKPLGGTLNVSELGSQISTGVWNQPTADVMFVLDCTGSMGGEIEAIKDTIVEFADRIESDGVQVRVGLVEFRDRLNREEHRVLTFKGHVFTSDADAFRLEVAKLKANGGGDEPESSLDAILFALRQPFSAQSNKVIVLVTDAPPHIPDKETQSIHQVMQSIADAGVQQLYLVIRTQDPNSQIYLKLLEPTRGMAFELGKGDEFRSRATNFKRILISLGKTISQATR